MAPFHNLISKFLLGLTAVAWTACSSDSGTGANLFAPASSSSGDLADSISSQGESSNSVEQMSSSSQKVSLTRKNFFNVDSLIAAAKQPKVITDSCVSARNYCETFTGENASGSYAVNVLFEKRIDEILESPQAESLTERCKSYLQKEKEFFFSVTHPITVYGISPCYNADNYIPGETTSFKIRDGVPYIFEKIDNAGICGDGVPNHVKVDSTYLNKVKENNEKYAKDFEDVMNYFLDEIEEECK
ncbi:MAG: hypothetical protein IKN03_02620 [Fibrobacter sp.]|nr:hypothetical protein [Fibrobacter sp.]